MKRVLIQKEKNLNQENQNHKEVKEEVKYQEVIIKVMMVQVLILFLIMRKN